MDQATQDKLRAELTQERKDIVSQLEEMGISAETGNPTEVDFEQSFADSGAATAEKARLLSIAEGLLETLHEIDAAFERMDESRFGRCESCGDEIPGERLEARPYARECVKCKQRR